MNDHLIESAIRNIGTGRNMEAMMIKARDPENMPSYNSYANFMNAQLIIMLSDEEISDQTIRKWLWDTLEDLWGKMSGHIFQVALSNQFAVPQEQSQQTKHQIFDVVRQSFYEHGRITYQDLEQFFVSEVAFIFHSVPKGKRRLRSVLTESFTALSSTDQNTEWS